jgi:hypothetical protein
MTYQQYYDSLLNLLNKKENDLLKTYSALKDKRGYIDYQTYLKYIRIKKELSALNNKCTALKASLIEGQTDPRSKLPVDMQKAISLEDD